MLAFAPWGPIQAKIWWAIAALLLALSTRVTADEPIKGGPPTFSISGTVLNSETSRPIVDVIVSARPQGVSSDRMAGIRSGPDGHFAITGLAAGRYTILSEKAGFMAGSYGGGTGQPVTISGDLDITVRLVPWAVITGRITDPNHDPLIGATVQLLQAKILDGHLRLAVAAQIPTNDLGEYRFFGVQPGHYYVGTFYRDGRERSGSASPTGRDERGSAGILR
jgi:hypothetical protein